MPLSANPFAGVTTPVRTMMNLRAVIGAAAIFGLATSAQAAFLLEIDTVCAAEFEAGLAKAGVEGHRVGEVTADGRLDLAVDGETRITTTLGEMRRAWGDTLPALFPAGAFAAGGDA